MVKDFGIVQDTAGAMNMPMPLVNLVKQFYLSLVASGRGGLDYWALLQIWEEMAGLQH
jgi:3-hydroxyisobutyrate dehydrogenase-like beta-hydroxyacid dehydrogenase